MTRHAKAFFLVLFIASLTSSLSSAFAPLPLPIQRKQYHAAMNGSPVDDNDVDLLPRITDAEPAPSGVRDTELGRMARGIARTGMKDVDSLQVGDIVVAKYEIPSLSIWTDFGYEITSIYAQGVSTETGQVEKIPLQQLSEDIPKPGYARYLKVFSPNHHSEPVVVTPEEMGLVTLKAELQQAMLLAVPGFFWVFVASAFSNYYTDKYGGSFIDAFFRT